MGKGKFMALKKIYKKIKRENGTLIIYGSNRWLNTEYKKPEWGEERELSFLYRGSRYFYSEFMRVERHASDFMQEFAGYRGDSHFSGVLIKLNEEGDKVKAFTYIA